MQKCWRDPLECRCLCSRPAVYKQATPPALRAPVWVPAQPAGVPAVPPALPPVTLLPPAGSICPLLYSPSPAGFVLPHQQHEHFKDLQNNEIHEQMKKRTKKKGEGQDDKEEEEKDCFTRSKPTSRTFSEECPIPKPQIPEIARYSQLICFHHVFSLP